MRLPECGDRGTSWDVVTPTTKQSTQMKPSHELGIYSEKIEIAPWTESTQMNTAETLSPACGDVLKVQPSLKAA